VSLFELFEDYYQSVLGDVLPVAFSTFKRYFNRNLEFSFRQPRTDICNVCFNKDQQGTLEHSDEVQYRLHKKRVIAYSAMKKKLLTTVPILVR